MRSAKSYYKVFPKSRLDLLSTNMSEETAEEDRLLPHKAGVSDPTTTGFSISRHAACCLLLYFLVEMYDMVTIAPLTSLFEKALCRSYYTNPEPSMPGFNGPIREIDCKNDIVQAKLAILRGWKLAFDALPGEQSLPQGSAMARSFWVDASLPKE